MSRAPTGGPALVHTDLCIELARGVPEAVAFFAAPPIEIRLSTATYLELLAAARTAEEQARVRRFVQPFPVLSLGPMASSRAVELVQEHRLTHGLGPIDALIAATALAHEIPLYVRDARSFVGIVELAVVVPF
jgi:predicted nucleic acid-binding protein